VRLSNALWTVLGVELSQSQRSASGGTKVGLWLRTRGLVAEAAGEWGLYWGLGIAKAPQIASAAL